MGSRRSVWKLGVGQICVLLACGGLNDLSCFLWQHTMQGLFWAWDKVGERESLSGGVLPAHHSALLDCENQTATSHGYALVLGSLEQGEYLEFSFHVEPRAGYRSHEPPLVFFLRMASSTAWSARARSFCWSSFFSAS